MTQDPDVSTQVNVYIGFNAPDPGSASDMVPDLIDAVEIHHALKVKPIELARIVKKVIKTFDNQEPTESNYMLYEFGGDGTYPDLSGLGL